jgi:hypothetical protein
MGERIGDIQQRVVPRLRQARRVAITAGAVGAGVVIIGGVAVLTLAARRRRRRRSLRGRVEAVADAVSHPDKTVEKAEKAVEQMAAETRESIKAELHDELKKELELQDREPLRERLLSTVVKTAATSAIPIILRQLEKRAR